MMFFKATFALYLAAIALAQPSPQGGDVGATVDGAGTFSLNLCLLCTRLSTIDMSVKNVGKTVGDLAGDTPVDTDGTF